MKIKKIESNAAQPSKSGNAREQAVRAENAKPGLKVRTGVKAGVQGPRAIFVCG